jgi:large subunit ribosomal protein L18
MKNNKTARRLKIKRRSRISTMGTAERPRLCVFRSNKQIYAQLINDADGVTLCAASSREKDVVSDKITKVNVAKTVGTKIAEKAKEAGIESVVFDRNGYLYHGRIQSLAEGAREGGLKF